MTSSKSVCWVCEWIFENNNFSNFRFSKFFLALNGLKNKNVSNLNFWQIPCRISVSTLSQQNILSWLKYIILILSKSGSWPYDSKKVRQELIKGRQRSEIFKIYFNLKNVFKNILGSKKSLISRALPVREVALPVS